MHHSDKKPLTCLAVHTKPCSQVFVWNATTKQIRMTATGFHTVGVSGLAWSPCGSLLASVGADEHHRLQIVEAETAQPVFRAR